MKSGCLLIFLILTLSTSPSLVSSGHVGGAVAISKGGTAREVLPEAAFEGEDVLGVDTEAGSLLQSPWRTEFPYTPKNCKYWQSLPVVVQ